MARVVRPMALGLPGDFVLYCRPDRPPWPAVVLSTDMLPRNMRKVRHSEVEAPVLLLQKWSVRWEYRPRLEVYGDYECPEEVAKKHPGLRQAHNFMFEAIADGLGPSHWGSILAAMNDLENPDVPPDEPDRNESGPDDTIEASFLEQLRDKRAVSDEPGDDQMTGSPPKMLRTEVRASAIGLSKRASKAASVSQQHDVHSPLRRRADSAHQASHTPMSTTSTSQRGLDHSNNNLSTNNYGGSDYDELHGSSSEASPIGTLEAGQPMDPAKDHEKLVDEATCWLIGPSLTKFYIPYDAIAGRPHLMRMDIMQWHGENGWKVTKPSFTDIEPDQFRPVAEYLSTGDFKTPAPGHTGQLLEGDELKSEAIGVLAESWSVAESLGLHDMMQVIVSKMKALRPWPQDEVMAFAKRVYSTQAIADFPVDADIEMKKLISSYIAVNYDGYVIKGPQTFLEELRSFPELRKDVHEAMAIDAAEEMNNE